MKNLVECQLKNLIDFLRMLLSLWIPDLKAASQFLLVIRHPRTGPNVLVAEQTEGYYYAVTGADKSVTPDAVGYQQAASCASKVARFFRAGAQLSAIYCSEYFRTQFLARVIQSAHQYPVEIVCDPRLAKRNYGDFWNITYQGVQALFPEEWEKYLAQGPYLYRPPGGQNYQDVQSNVREYFRDVINGSLTNSCIVTHSHPYLVIEQLLAGMANEEVVRRYEEMAVENVATAVYYRRALGSPWRRCPSWWYQLWCMVDGLPESLRTRKLVGAGTAAVAAQQEPVRD